MEIRETGAVNEAEQRDEVMRRIQEEFAPLLREQAGYRGYLALIDEEDEHGRVVTFWASSAAADRCFFPTGSGGRWLQERLAPLLTDPPRIARAATIAGDLDSALAGSTGASVIFALPLSAAGRAGGD